MARQVKPPFAYYGGKTTLAPAIADLLPPHGHYVEPFAGSLAVLLVKAPSEMETVNDIDGDLMAFWRALRDQPEELYHACELTPHSRAELKLSSVTTDIDDIERARRVWVRLTQSRSHSMKPTGWWQRKNAATGHSPPMYIQSYATRMAASAQRLRLVSLECRDALDVIRDYGTEPSVCIYADPPYVGSTRATNYGHEMTEDAQHAEFAEVCNEAKANIVISGYASPLYDELFPGWHRTELKAPTKLSSETGATEVLWSNVPLGKQSAFDFAALEAT